MKQDYTSQLQEAVREDRKFKDMYHFFSLEENVLAKVMLENRAKNEYGWGSFLFDRGFQVGQFYQLLSPEQSQITLRGYKSPWSIIMQKIEGVEMGKLPGSLQKEALRQYREQVTRALDLGILPMDSNWHGNNLFNVQEDKLYLIDFEDWRYGSPQEIDSFYRMVKEDGVMHYTRN